MRAHTGSKGSHIWTYRWTRMSYLAFLIFGKQVSVQHPNNSISPGQMISLFGEEGHIIFIIIHVHKMPSASPEILGNALRKQQYAQANIDHKDEQSASCSHTCLSRSARCSKKTTYGKYGGKQLVKLFFGILTIQERSKSRSCDAVAVATADISRV